MNIHVSWMRVSYISISIDSRTKIYYCLVADKRTKNQTIGFMVQCLEVYLGQELMVCCLQG